jgi:hypothetical protein
MDFPMLRSDCFLMFLNFWFLCRFSLLRLELFEEGFGLALSYRFVAYLKFFHPAYFGVVESILKNLFILLPNFKLTVAAVTVILR